MQASIWALKLEVLNSLPLAEWSNSAMDGDDGGVARSSVPQHSKNSILSAFTRSSSLEGISQHFCGVVMKFVLKLARFGR